MKLYKCPKITWIPTALPIFPIRLQVDSNMDLTRKNSGVSRQNSELPEWDWRMNKW
ncbi:hypothetical protein F7734_02350 [Scytonema sp. UIC 10036]|uniref:hypothetical protein n=1 Tax=Scytonema sp. UIC 10036 TaxID=2304196 RepID=UPI0012DA33D1|nr:hypothetical protein [Scytonema sp. UIC 10036]MUG91391.1 hypothetical protein [Scytonema sp. UIC 10036]